ncbi:ABC transporter permease subunit [Aquicoccus sp. SCR17]|nr:ABC transporter permease subunit [Carideicomes alvinocaridis]
MLHRLPVSPGRIAAVLLPVLLLLALEQAVDSGAVRRALIPAPSDVWGELVYILQGGHLWAPLGKTLYLLAVAYGCASVLAIGLGLLMGRSRAVYNLFEPLVEVIRPLPKPALLPPLILFLGIGDTMKMTVVGLAVFFPVLINTVQGVRGVDPVLVETARTFGYSGGRIVSRVVLPAALPFIFTGLRIALGLGLILVVVAEMLAGTGGIGFLIVDMQRTFQVTSMYAWLVILAVLGFLLNLGFERLEARLMFWSRQSEGRA